jgi:predicted amidohydrolase
MALTRDRLDLNYEEAKAMAAQAADNGADLLVLPELWQMGYNLERVGDHARPLDEGPFAQMGDLAQKHGIYVTGSAAEANPHGLPFNTMALYGPTGERLGAYRKIHLFPLTGELEHFAPGAGMPVFDLPWGRTALAICYDLRFPELWQRFAAGGAGLVLVSAQWPVPRIEHWRLLLRARAVDNLLFVAGCNRAGKDVDGDFGGQSAAVDPLGRVLVEAGPFPGLSWATIDTSLVAKVRQKLPFLNDHRPNLYG